MLTEQTKQIIYWSVLSIISTVALMLSILALFEIKEIKTEFPNLSIGRYI